MKIVADKDIPGVEKAFAHFGELLLLPGRRIRQDDVRDADALVVRTVTRVDEALVNGTALQFIGSATSGTDHVDTEQLEKRGIQFCHAPGCNADAVVDYVLAALSLLAEQCGEHWRLKHVGIIGAGNVGSRLAWVFLRLGMPVTIYDPLLEPTHKLADYFGTFEEVVSCDIVTLHVPLTKTGPHPTFHMLDAKTLELLKNGAVLINASRGEVVDNPALSEHLKAHPDLQVVLDTWENEPAIHSVLLGQVAIATPHIAGYSRKGKSNGTAAILKLFCEYFGLQLSDLPVSDPGNILMLRETDSYLHNLDRAILQAYPIASDQLDRHDPKVVYNFESRRNNYAFRKEFGEFSFQADKVTTALAADLSALRFLYV